MFNRYLLPMFVILAVVAVLNTVGNAAGFYYTIGWYDWVAHFLGGAWVACFALWIARAGYLGRYGKLVTVKNIILFGLAVGLAWEIFELAFGITYWGDRGYWFDTGHDLLMDLVGASVVALLYRRSIDNDKKDGR